MSAPTGRHRDRQSRGDAGCARHRAACGDHAAVELSRDARSRSLAEKPRHHRARRHRYPRADRAHPRKGHAERGDRPRAIRPIRSRRTRARRKAWPGLLGMDLVPKVTSGQRFTWRETPWTWGEGYGERTDAKYHVVAIDYGIKRNILRQLAGHGCDVTVVPANDLCRRHPGAQAGRRFPLQRSRRSGGDRRICRAGDPHADRQAAGLRHLPRPSDARPRRRRQDHEDASGPSRRQSSGEGSADRQGRDHVDEPRLCGRPRDTAGERAWKLTSRCSTARIAGSRSRTGRCSRCNITPRPRPARGTAIICSAASSSTCAISSAPKHDREKWPPISRLREGRFGG